MQWATRFYFLKTNFPRAFALLFHQCPWGQKLWFLLSWTVQCLIKTSSHKPEYFFRNSKKFQGSWRTFGSISAIFSALGATAQSSALMTQKQLIQYNSDFLIARFFLFLFFKDSEKTVFDQAFKNAWSYNFFTYPNNQVGLLYLHRSMSKYDYLII